jgi:elongator complex protein 4
MIPANPALSTAFPLHHGLLRIERLPALQTLVPPSDRFSTLRGSVGGSGENNLGFKCTRKRLVFETLHLDVDGGVGERRTTPGPGVASTRDASAAAVRVEVEGAAVRSKKEKKRVVFESGDRPELYDF